MKKRILFAFCFLALLASCGTKNIESLTTSDNSQTSIDGTITSSPTTEEITTIDTSPTINTGDTSDYEGAISINLAQDATTATSETVIISENIVTITASGTYILSGTLSNGTVIVTTTETDPIILVLNGVSINCNSIYSPITCTEKKGGELHIVNAEGSSNYLSDNRTYEDVEANSHTGGVINSKSITRVLGSGTLTVIGNAKNGIQTSKALYVDASTINISVYNNGLKANDGIFIGNTLEPTLHVVTKAGDGISNDGSKTVDTPINIQSGKITLEPFNDGIQGELLTSINISGGDLNIICGGGAVSSNSGYDGEESHKGIKNQSNMNISGGNIFINSLDDALHSTALSTTIARDEAGVYDSVDTEPNLTISGGNLNIKTGDDAIHSGAFLNITNSANIEVLQCYEGIEAPYIEVLGGITSITSTDDGFNAACQKDYNDKPFISENLWGDKIYLNFKGGKTFVDSSGDGLDSNGDLYVSGSDTVVVVSGPGGNGDGQIDYGDSSTCTFTVDGGLFVAYGSGGQMDNFKTSGSQATAYLGNVSCPSTSYMIIKDSSSNYLYAIDIVGSTTAKTLFISSPLFSNETYYCTVATSITSTEEIFGSVFKINEVYGEGSSSSSFSFTSSSLHVNTGSGGNFGPGGGGRP